MIKEIQYAGYSTEPSDYECADGQLATSLNLISESGQLKPLFQPSSLFSLSGGKTVVFIHKTSAFTHYIVKDTSTGTLKWFDDSVITKADEKPVASSVIDTELAKTSPSHSLHSFGSVVIYRVNAVGNTLVILAADGMHYILWKSTTEGYLYLGTHIPECPMAFGLQYEWMQGDEFKVEYGGHSLMYDSSKYGSAFCNTYDTNSSVGSLTNEKYITQRVLAQANKFIAEKATNEGRFVYPFVVRYAYKLYDGNYTMASAPILMPCVTGCSPLPLVTRRSYNGNGDAHGYYECWWVKITAPIFDMMYKVVQASALTALKKWGDIVKSVDIFISKPIYTYDQNGTIESNVPITTIDFKVYGKNTASGGYTSAEALTRIKKYISDNDYAHDDTCAGYLTPLPARTHDAVTGDVENASNFYLLKSYNLDELKTSLTKVEVKSDYLQSLVTRQTLTDDYDSHDTLIPKYSFAFNARLNLAGISKTLFKGYDPASMCTCFDRGDNIKNVWVYIKQDGKEVIVQCTPSSTVYGNIMYFYYPNANAYKAVVQYGSSYVVYSLSAHPFLSGAYFFKDFSRPTETVSSAPVASSDKQVDLPNKIYTSEVNNPFFFPVLGINTVGTGTILGICSAVKALSQGQFGQFPLYAFTTEGVWALEVSSTGSYSARQPVTRDVCVNDKSITQIDDAVLFATDRGIMLIQGSQTQCVSDIIFSEAPFNVLELPCADQLHAKLGHSADTCLPVKPFLGFLTECRMLYDYVHQRIIVYNPSKDTDGNPLYTYAYVFSLKSKQWGMMYSGLASGLNAYPDALAMTHAGAMVSFGTTDETVSHGLYITRPLKLDAPDVLKTVSAVIQRGHFKRGDVATVLYGSRDLYTWRLVWSSVDHYLRGFRGTPYKYFRIAGVAALADGESVFGASVQCGTRHTNNLR